MKLNTLVLAVSAASLLVASAAFAGDKATAAPAPAKAVHKAHKKAHEKKAEAAAPAEAK